MQWLLLTWLAVVLCDENNKRGFVLELNDDTFSTAVGGEEKQQRSVLVAFVAPWCGHCKAISGAWNQTAEVFAGSEVALARLDAHESSVTAKRYSVKGYPTLRYFHRGSAEGGEEYIGGRTTDDLVKFLNTRNGLQRAPVDPLSLVGHVNQKGFDALVGGDAGAFVMFYAPWCPHSKALQPIYSQVAAAFEHEAAVRIVRVDATREAALMKAEGISAYPTIKYYPPGSSAGKVYDKARDSALMVAHINMQQGTFRNLAGTLTDKAGRVQAVDEIVAGLASKGNGEREERAAKALALIRGVCNGECSAEKHPQAHYYAAVLGHMRDRGPGHIEAEVKRLVGILEGGSLSPRKRDGMLRKRNILTAFAA